MNQSNSYENILIKEYLHSKCHVTGKKPKLPPTAYFKPQDDKLSPYIAKFNSLVVLNGIQKSSSSAQASPHGPKRKVRSRPSSAACVNGYKKTIVVHVVKNGGDPDNSQRVAASSLDEILTQATQKLNLDKAAHKLFLGSGQEINFFDDLERDIEVYVSCGEPFKKPAHFKQSKIRPASAATILESGGKNFLAKKPPKLSRSLRPKTTFRRAQLFPNGIGSNDVRIELVIDIVDLKWFDKLSSHTSAKFGVSIHNAFDIRGENIRTCEDLKMSLSFDEEILEAIGGLTLWCGSGETFQPSGAYMFLTEKLKVVASNIQEKKHFLNKVTKMLKTIYEDAIAGRDERTPPAYEVDKMIVARDSAQKELSTLESQQMLLDKLRHHLPEAAEKLADKPPRKRLFNTDHREFEFVLNGQMPWDDGIKIKYDFIKALRRCALYGKWRKSGLTEDDQAPLMHDLTAYCARFVVNNSEYSPPGGDDTATVAQRLVLRRFNGTKVKTVSQVDPESVQQQNNSHLPQQQQQKKVHKFVLCKENVEFRSKVEHCVGLYCMHLIEMKKGFENRPVYRLKSGLQNPIYRSGSMFIDWSNSDLLETQFKWTTSDPTPPANPEQPAQPDPKEADDKKDDWKSWSLKKFGKEPTKDSAAKSGNQENNDEGNFAPCQMSTVAYRDADYPDDGVMLTMPCLTARKVGQVFHDKQTGRRYTDSKRFLPASLEHWRYHDDGLLTPKAFGRHLALTLIDSNDGSRAFGDNTSMYSLQRPTWCAPANSEKDSDDLFWRCALLKVDTRNIDRIIRQKWQMTSDGNFFIDWQGRRFYLTFDSSTDLAELDDDDQLPGGSSNKDLHLPSILLATTVKLTDGRASRQRFGFRQTAHQLIGQWQLSDVDNPEWSKRAITWPGTTKMSLIHDEHLPEKAEADIAYPNRRLSWPVCGLFLPFAPALRRELTTVEHQELRPPTKLFVMKNTGSAVGCSHGVLVNINENEQLTAMLVNEITRKPGAHHSQGLEASSSNLSVMKWLEKVGKKRSSLGPDSQREDVGTRRLNMCKLEFDTFLQQATEQLHLGFAARRLYTQDGHECSSLRDPELLNALSTYDINRGEGEPKMIRAVYVTCGESLNTQMQRSWNDSSALFDSHHDPKVQLRYFIQQLEIDLKRLEAFVHHSYILPSQQSDVFVITVRTQHGEPSVGDTLAVDAPLKSITKLEQNFLSLLRAKTTSRPNEFRSHDGDDDSSFDGAPGSRHPVSKRPLYGREKVLQAYNSHGRGDADETDSLNVQAARGSDEAGVDFSAAPVFKRQLFRYDSDTGFVELLDNPDLVIEYDEIDDRKHVKQGSTVSIRINKKRAARSRDLIRQKWTYDNDSRKLRTRKDSTMVLTVKIDHYQPRQQQNGGEVNHFIGNQLFVEQEKTSFLYLPQCFAIDNSVNAERSTNRSGMRSQSGIIRCFSGPITDETPIGEDPGHWSFFCAGVFGICTSCVRRDAYPQKGHDIKISNNNSLRVCAPCFKATNAVYRSSAADGAFRCDISRIHAIQSAEDESADLSKQQQRSQDHSKLIRYLKATASAPFDDDASHQIPRRGQFNFIPVCDLDTHLAAQCTVEYWRGFIDRLRQDSIQDVATKRGLTEEELEMKRENHRLNVIASWNDLGAANSIDNGDVELVTVSPPSILALLEKCNTPMLYLADGTALQTLDDIKRYYQANRTKLAHISKRQLQRFQTYSNDMTQVERLNTLINELEIYPVQVFKCREYGEAFKAGQSASDGARLSSSGLMKDTESELLEEKHKLRMLNAQRLNSSASLTQSQSDELRRNIAETRNRIDYLEQRVLRDMKSDRARRGDTVSKSVSFRDEIDTDRTAESTPATTKNVNSGVVHVQSLRRKVIVHDGDQMAMSGEDAAGKPVFVTSLPALLRQATAVLAWTNKQAVATFDMESGSEITQFDQVTTGQHIAVVSKSSVSLAARFNYHSSAGGAATVMSRSKSSLGNGRHHYRADDGADYDDDDDDDDERRNYSGKRLVRHPTVSDIIDRKSLISRTNRFEEVDRTSAWQSTPSGASHGLQRQEREDFRRFMKPQIKDQ